MADDRYKELAPNVKKAEEAAKKFSAAIGGAESMTESLYRSLFKVKKLGDENSKVYQTHISLAEELLENIENIGTEEFKSVDATKEIIAAKKKGDKVLVKQLKSLRNISKEHENINKQISAAADLAAKPFEAIDSFIREIPVVGDFLAAAVGSSGWGDAVRQGFVEGTTSGLVESMGLFEKGGLVSKAIGGIKGAFGQPLSKKQIEAGFGGKAAKDHLAETGEIIKTGMVANFRAAGLAVKGITIGLGAAAVVLSAMAAKAISFANETGLSYGNVLRMGPALLINSDAVKAFANELGTVNNLTAMQSFELRRQSFLYGLNAETAAKLFAVQRGITGASMDTFLAQQETTANLARQEGVSPAAVFDDMAQSAEFIAKFSDATGENMAEAAVQARKMGINLGKVESIAEGLLDFETSIEKQMEAQVLLGRSINLDRARTLFYNNKTKEALQEVSNQLGGIGALNEMDFIQRKAVADLLNVQVSDLSRIMGAQEGVNEAIDKSISGAVMFGIGIGAIAGLAASIVPVIIGSIPGLQGLGIKQLAKGLAITAGGVAAGGLAGYAISSQMEKSKLPKLASGGVIVGEKGPEVVAPLPPQGVNVDNTGIESRMDKLLEQNQFLMNKLIRTTGELSLNNA